MIEGCSLGTFEISAGIWILNGFNAFMTQRVLGFDKTDLNLGRDTNGLATRQRRSSIHRSRSLLLPAVSRVIDVLHRFAADS
jgi:hypothetical protein